MKISQEAREAAQVLTTHLSIRGLKDGQIERSMQSLINSTLERAVGVAKRYANPNNGAVFTADAIEAAIRQLMESE